MDLTKEDVKKELSIGLQNWGFSKEYYDNAVNHLGLIIENCPSCEDRASCGLGDSIGMNLKEQEIKEKVWYFASKYKCPVFIDLCRIYKIDKNDLYSPFEISKIELGTMNASSPREAYNMMSEIRSEMIKIKKLNSEASKKFKSNKYRK